MPNGDYLWRVNDHAQDAPRDRAALEARRRSLRRVRQGDGRDGAVRQADPRHDAARSDVARSARARSSCCSSGSRFQRLPRQRPIQPGPADDDERGRLSRSVVRDRRAQGDDVGVGDHRHVPRRAIAGHRLRAAAPLHGRDRRRVPLVGLRPRRHRRDLATRSPARRARPASRSGPRRRSRRFSSQDGARRGVVLDERRRDRRPTSSLERRSAPDVPADSSTPSSCRAISSRTSSATSSAARPAR